MAKQKTVFVCQNCAYQAPRWLGKCPDCGSWNTLTEEAVQRSTEVSSATPPSEVLNLSHISAEDPVPRIVTGFGELDGVLGGGLVSGSFTLIGGDPGIGKSTLMLQTMAHISQKRKILYISGEESVRQTQLRAQRLKASGENLYLASETNIQNVLSHCEKLRPEILVVDSIQTAYDPEFQSAPGSVTQVRETAASLMTLAKGKNIAVILIGHVTKEGNIAGPKVLEHMVDTVLSFEGDNQHHHRILRCMKNRFGPSGELAIFEMTSLGLREVTNPSEVFIGERAANAVGSSIYCAVEGTRPFLVEVQALVTRSNMAMPRRTAVGIDPNRIHLLLAVLDRHLGLDMFAHDVFVNVVGGLKINEPASDLAVVASLLSSLRNKPLPQKASFFGEVGLTGEVRGVSLPELRIKESHKLGFEELFLPKTNQKQMEAIPKSQKPIWIPTVSELEGKLF